MSDQVDVLLARAQVGLAFFFSLGFLTLLFVLIFFRRDMSPPESQILTGLLAVLGTIVTQQSAYFFARHRQPTSADSEDDGPLGPPSPVAALPLSSPVAPLELKP